MNIGTVIAERASTVNGARRWGAAAPLSDIRTARDQGGKEGAVSPEARRGAAPIVRRPGHDKF